MAGFLGNYRHQFDAKGRISLPAPFRRGREEEPFVLIHIHSDNLSLYPEEHWQPVEQELRDMARRQAEFRTQILALTSQAHEVRLDKQGRILVPDRLRQAVGLGSEAVIAGALNRIEIWSPERFDEAVKGRSPEFQHLVTPIFS
ncbi:MAG: division/cell wall cluster transcriptional repressor MraZ [Gemmatimonadota bacterium]